MTDWYTYSCSCETKLCNRFSNWKVWVIYSIQFSHAANSGPLSSKCLKDQRPHEYPFKFLQELLVLLLVFNSAIRSTYILIITIWIFVSKTVILEIPSCPPLSLFIICAELISSWTCDDFHQQQMSLHRRVTGECAV